MTAEEMFDELGYRCIKRDYSICYINDSDDENNRSVDFYFCDCAFDATDTYGDPLAVNVKELEAINKQCEELGWLEEEKQETKQETNFEHYKDEIIEDYAQILAVVKGRPMLCYKTNCNDCDFKINQIGCREKAKDWLKQPHEKPVYKLTKFEKELLQCYPDIYSFKVFNSLNKMKEKGYFKGIDDNEIIGDILANCEVIE